MNRGACYSILLLALAISGCAASAAQQAARDREQYDLRAEVAALRTRMQELEGKVAALGKRVGAAQRTKPSERGADRTNPVDERAGAVGPSPPEERATPPPAPALPSPAAVPDLDLDGLRREGARQLPGRYQRGLDLLRAGAYEQSIQSMREFIRSKHTSPFVAGGQYWIGQAYMQLGQFYQAILAFTDVQQRFPQSDYAPAAGYAIGLAFLQLGNVSEARHAFEVVIAEHPDVPEATKARARLAGLDEQAR